MNKPDITESCVQTVAETKFVKMYDLQYAPGKHYFDATRRDKKDIVAIKPMEEFQKMTPDAVSCFVILILPGEKPKLLLFYEFRYPTGQFLLSPPAGLVDPKDKEAENPLVETAKREIFEETGIRAKETDTLKVVNPLVFSTPGMTDESNGLVCAILHPDNLDCLSQGGAVGTECFDGFCIVDKEKAREILFRGTDDRGNFYSLYTWAALTYFVSDLWEMLEKQA